MGPGETVGPGYDQLCGLEQPLCAFAHACEMGLMKSSPGLPHRINALRKKAQETSFC
jgi:hypothetical protein